MHNYIRVMIMKALNLNPRKESPVKEKAKRSFLRAFTRAAAVVLISSGLMVGCAGNNSNVRSDSTKQTEVAKAGTKSPSKEVTYKEIAKAVRESGEAYDDLIEHVMERARLVDEMEEARAKKEEARAERKDICDKMYADLKSKDDYCKENSCSKDILEKIKYYWQSYYEGCSDFIAGLKIK